MLFFLFFNWPDSYYNNVRGNEVIKIVPSQLQRVNMSHSSFFQPDLFVFNVGPRNAMFYDVVLRQRDRLLCSVQKEKNTYKNTKYVFYSPISVGFFTCFININAFKLCFYTEVQQLLVLIMIVFPWTSFTKKYREGNVLSFKGYYNR